MDANGMKLSAPEGNDQGFIAAADMMPISTSVAPMVFHHIPASHASSRGRKSMIVKPPTQYANGE
jgi:hypothetical protein